MGVCVRAPVLCVGRVFGENAVCSQSMAYYIVPTGPMQPCTAKNDKPVVVFLITDSEVQLLHCLLKLCHYTTLQDKTHSETQWNIVVNGA